MQWTEHEYVEKRDYIKPSIQPPPDVAAAYLTNQVMQDIYQDSPGDPEVDSQIPSFLFNSGAHIAQGKSHQRWIWEINMSVALVRTQR